MKRVLCVLGFHDWSARVHPVNEKYHAYFRCKRCDKKVEDAW